MYDKRFFSPKNKNFSLDILNNKKVTSILNVIALFSSIGLLSSFTIFYKYFSINELQPYTPDTFAIVMSSLLLLFYIFALYIVMMFGTFFTFIELEKINNNNKITKMWMYGLIRILLFYILLIIPSVLEVHWFENIRILSGYIIALILLFSVSGYLYFYKINEKNNPVTLSFEFLFYMYPVMILYLLAAYEKMASIYAIAYIALIIFVIYSLPYIFIREFPKRYKIKFIFTSFTLVAITSFIFSPKFFPEKIIQDLHMGNILYPELKIKKSQCEFINHLDYGYICKNNTIKDILGVWILGEYPIFQDKEKKLPKIHIKRSEIITVL